jgi:peptide/nickel transport system ATP-binding protein
MSEALLELRGLTVDFATDDGVVHAVDGIDLALGRGRTLGLVGESGCGKSVTSLAIMGLLPPENSKVGGQVVFEGRDLLTLDAHLLRDLRGARLAMIFQEPMTSLNPSYTIGDQIIEAIQRHQDLDKVAARARAIEVLTLVRIPSPERRIDDYPHKLSGGMRQRAMIAMALACGPQLLIADEPTTALDATVQAQVLELIREEQRARGLAMLLVSHDLGVVARMCERVVVLYAGQVVESGPAAQLLERPAHPYTAALVETVRALREAAGRAEGAARRPLPTIPGIVPSPGRWAAGCRFRERCGNADDRCSDPPPMRSLAERHEVRCVHPMGAR